MFLAMQTWGVYDVTYKQKSQVLLSELKIISSAREFVCACVFES